MNKTLKEWLIIFGIAFVIASILAVATHFYMLDNNFIYACSYYQWNCTGV